MNLTLDLEWSKKLKEAGIEGESVYCFVEGEDNKYYLQRDKNWEPLSGTIRFPTYTLEELLAMVEGAFWLVNYDLYEIRLEWEAFSNADPKIAVAEALLWQKGEGR